jgi:5'-methylthioadenosine phosphorylase
VAFAEPFCPGLRQKLGATLAALDMKHHLKATYVCMEGPAFSTKAESQLYRSWSGDIIGMTNLPEAKLAREAEICYATLALSTDYDCWYEEMGSVSADAVVKQIHENVHNAQKVLAEVVKRADDTSACHCQRALDTALLTDLKRAPQEAKERLKLLLERFY